MKHKIVVFGTGVFFERRKEFLPKEVQIIAFLDNDITAQGKLLDGIPIYPPSDISNMTYDCIILASISWVEMRKQLRNLGIDDDKIFFWDEFISKNSHGILVKYEPDKKLVQKCKKKILIISYITNYGGGFMAVFNAAVVLQKMGYEVVIASAQILSDIVKEVNEQGISVWMCPSIPYIEESELNWIKKFDYIIANCLQTILCAERVSKYVPTMLWLHEYSEQYESALEQYGKEIDTVKLNELMICAVSNPARRNFLKYFPKQLVSIFPYGILDGEEIGDDNSIVSKDAEIKVKSMQNRIIIAIIGNISALKNQKGLIRSLDRLSPAHKEKIECWIIGRDGSKQYKKELVEMIQNKPYVRMCGEYTRAQMKEAYDKIDVVINTSTEEMLSTVIAEGMMYGKIVVVNENNGISEYIENGINGYIYQEGNEEELSALIDKIITDFEQLEKMKWNARKTYEQNFSENQFRKRIKTVLELLEKNRNSRTKRINE